MLPGNEFIAEIVDLQDQVYDMATMTSQLNTRFISGREQHAWALKFPMEYRDQLNTFLGTKLQFVDAVIPAAPKKQGRIPKNAPENDGEGPARRETPMAPGGEE